MRTVWKYPVPVQDDFALTMPQGATILSVQAQGSHAVPGQGGQPVLWALVDPDAPITQRQFRLAGTGHPVPDDPGTYVGTFQLYGGGFIGHLWEVPR